MSDWVLVACPGWRTHELLRLLGNLKHPASQVCIITTEPDPVARMDIDGMAEHLVHLSAEISYSKWMNAGLDHIASVDAEQRYVFITGSDTLCEASVIPGLIRGAEARGLVMSCPDPWSMGEIVLDPRRRELFYRITPEHFLLDLRAGLRLDEQFRWWYAEDDLEMQARQKGPVGFTIGVYAHQPDQHEMSPQVAAWAVEDRIRFARKWGREPW